jgi:hypothetical protein
MRYDRSERIAMSERTTETQRQSESLERVKRLIASLDPPERAELGVWYVANFDTSGNVRPRRNEAPRLREPHVEDSA